MNKALGMIEVYGYLAAVEALDSALKAANVSRDSVVRTGGGLVAVLIRGDVGAVKAAVDAAAAAAGRVGRVVSIHVIPRPAQDTEMLLGGDQRRKPENGPGPEGDGPGSGEKPVFRAEDAQEEEAAENFAEAKIEAVKDEQAEEAAENFAEAKTEAAKDEQAEGAAENFAQPEAISEEVQKQDSEDAGVEVTAETEGEASEDTSGDEPENELLSRKETTARQIPAAEDMERMTVAALRRLAREAGTNLTRQEIRFARKQELIHAILEYTGQEN